MSTLIGMAVYDTEENGRSKFTKRTIESLLETVDFSKHSLIIVDNNSCQETQDIYDWLDEHVIDSNEIGSSLSICLVRLDKNVGTANAINLAMKELKEGEFFIKMDNDVVFHKVGWVDEMEEVIQRMPNIGILGLKRKDVCESVYSINPDQKSKLIEVPHKPGERWHVVEECKHVMGTCTMLNPALIDKVGYFYQMNGLYGFDDSLMCIRSSKAGFKNCFMHGIEIDHIDDGSNAEYTEWKSKYAGDMIQKYANTEYAYMSGAMSIYYNPFQE